MYDQLNRQMQTFLPPLFGRSPSYKNAGLVVLAVPWAPTASNGRGAENGPLIATLCSSNMDVYSQELGGLLNTGIFLDEEAMCSLFPSSLSTREKALPTLKLEEGAGDHPPNPNLNAINQACNNMVKWVYDKCALFYQDGKKAAVLGGDHSTSEGLLLYLSEKWKGNFGILHIDAHADLREHYQGFTHSHASIMYNVLHFPHPPQALVQVGIRDYCKEEYLRIKNASNIKTFFDWDLKEALFKGQSWDHVTKKIFSFLPEKVYISLDVDGLSAHIFPHTGTPVPGGLSFEQVNYLLTCLAHSSKHRIIGFDLVEISSPTKITKKLMSKMKSQHKDPHKSSLKNTTPYHWTKELDMQEVISPLSLAEAQAGSFLLYKLCRSMLFNM